MADTVLQSIALRNWTTVRQAEITFPERGLVLVRGVNTTAKGKMASIGSGKTALGEAISRALFEVKGRYTQLGNFSFKGKGDTYVKVSCRHKGKPLIVEMGFKCPELSLSGEGFKYTYDGAAVSRDTIDHTRADLAKLLTVPTDLASWTVYLDGDKLRFNDLSERKAVELLMASLQQAPWTQYHRQANTTASSTKTQLENFEAMLFQAQASLKEVELELNIVQQNLKEAKTVYDELLAKNKKELKAALAKVATLNKAITDKRARMAEIKKEINQMVEANAAKEHKLEIAANEKQDALAALREDWAELRSSQAGLATELRQAKERLQEAKDQPESCPSCGQKIPCPDHAAVQALEDAVQMADFGCQEATKAVTLKAKEIEKAVQAVQTAKQALQEAKAEAPVSDLSQEYEELEEGVAADNRGLALAERLRAQLEAGPSKTEITRFQAVVTERKQQLAKVTKSVNAAALNVTETGELLRVAEYWQEAFGPSGIPNMVLRDAIGPLNSTAKRISTVLTGGVISVSYDTSRELAAGKGIKAELVIKVKNETGSIRFDGSSKGESGLSELIVAETLAEVGGVANRIGYRWFDEVCPNQDELVRRSIYAYLADVAKRYGILVFLVSHSPEAASYADLTLVAEKTPQGTVYRWD